MSIELPSWPRPHFVPGGGDAYAFYKVYGAFSSLPPRISHSVHRCSGVPDAVAIVEQRADSHPEAFRFGLEDLFGECLREKDAALYERVAAAPQCVAIQGPVADPATLEYFRDVIGIVTALLDAGGIAVFDPLILDWWTSDGWRTRVFDRDALVPKDHVLFMRSDNADTSQSWYHTRGMIKFGRPDLSVLDVAPAIASKVVELIERFAHIQALGEVVSEGQEVRMRGLPEGWRCFHEGDTDDPDFNNRHLHIGPPKLRHLTLRTDVAELSRLLASWKRLVAEPHRPFAVNYFGDLFLEGSTGRVVMLDTMSGELREIAEHRTAFESSLARAELSDDWFMPDLAFACLEQGLRPGAGQCLSFKVPPVLNGPVEVENIEVSDLALHHHFASQILQQVKDLPEGTPITAVRVDGEDP